MTLLKPRLDSKGSKNKKRRYENSEERRKERGEVGHKISGEVGA